MQKKIFVFFTLGLILIPCLGKEDVDERYELSEVKETLESFPDFIVPGYEDEMKSLRKLFYHHYLFVPGSTLWDNYIPQCILWPDTGDDPRNKKFINGIRDLLESRYFDPEGYISSHQHIGLAHPQGWPFPVPAQFDGFCWSFSQKHYLQSWIDHNLVQLVESLEDWKLSGFENQGIDPEKGLQLTVTKDHAVITPPEFELKGLLIPFVGIQWYLEGFEKTKIYKGINPRPQFYVQWKTKKNPEFNNKQKVYFTPLFGNDGTSGKTNVRNDLPWNGLVQDAVPLYRMIFEDDIITQIQIGIEKAKGAKLTIKTIYPAVDSRQQMNNFAYIQGCDDYIKWTGDLTFLRSQINYMRIALRYAIEEFGIEKYKCVNVPWFGHDGRPGISYDKDGNKTVHFGRGIGGSYYDIIPCCGGKDFLNTIYAYDVLLRLADLEQIILQNPQWNIPMGVLKYNSSYLRELAGEVKAKAQKVFWNEKNKRFYPGIDRDGKRYDYGFVFTNLEAIYYDVASKDQAMQIMDWITAKRIIEGDTSQREDIYKFRFAPRATTRRNLTYYTWSWSIPESIPFGDQVQDGGAVLGWSYYDLMSRIKVLGPDNAWQRLQEIIQWFDEVQAEGGYRAYYSKPGRGKLQGGDVAGGLGLDREFIESVLVPQVMIYGFMGLKPGTDRIMINPRLPSHWPELKITSIRWHDNLIDLTATNDKQIKIKVHSGNPKEIIRAIKSNDFNVQLFNNEEK